MKKQFDLVATGGTFDHFHKGHEALLMCAFSVGEKVVIGITSQRMVVGKVLAETIEPYRERKRSVERFLLKHKLASRAHMSRLTSPYGSLRTDTAIQAVVVGPHFTRHVIEEVRHMVDVVSCPAVYCLDGTILSSSRIRRGEVDREGYVYMMSSRKSLILPRSLRTRLRNPLGVLHNTIDIACMRRGVLLISVGDVSTRALNKRGIFPDLAIIDFHVRRKRVFTCIDELAFPQKGAHSTRNREKSTCRNPAGTLTPHLFRAVRAHIDRLLSGGARGTIVVDGEDDLAVLAVIYHAPLSSLIVYGQPPLSSFDSPEGMVTIEVTEKIKREARFILKQFSRSRA